MDVDNPNVQGFEDGANEKNNNSGKQWNSKKALKDDEVDQRGRKFDPNNMEFWTSLEESLNDDPGQLATILEMIEEEADSKVYRSVPPLYQHGKSGASSAGTRNALSPWNGTPASAMGLAHISPNLPKASADSARSTVGDVNGNTPKATDADMMIVPGKASKLAARFEELARKNKPAEVERRQATEGGVKGTKALRNVFESNKADEPRVRSTEPTVVAFGQRLAGRKGDNCSVCKKIVYEAEKVQGVSKGAYHRLCFKCSVCKLSLKMNSTSKASYHPGESVEKLYCAVHYQAFRNNMARNNFHCAEPRMVIVPTEAASSSELTCRQ